MSDHPGTGSTTPTRRGRKGRNVSTRSSRGRGTSTPKAKSSVSALPETSETSKMSASAFNPTKAVTSTSDITQERKQETEKAEENAGATTTEVTAPADNPAEAEPSTDTPPAARGQASFEEFKTPPTPPDEPSEEVVAAAGGDDKVSRHEIESSKKLEDTPQAERREEEVRKDSVSSSEFMTPRVKDNDAESRENTKPATSKAPDKPPRKVSSEKTLEIFPSSDPAPPVTYDLSRDEIAAAADVKAPDPKSEPSSRPESRRSLVSPGSFGYLGSPVGRPSYGIRGQAEDGEDMWSSVVRSRRPSISEIRNVAKGFTYRQWITLIIFGLADLVSAMVLSLQAPFYPPEAEKKGATATEYGLVFGIYELTLFIMSPIYGKYMNKLGPRHIFNIGISATAIACICFGMLDKVENREWFIGMSFLFRIMEALGASAFVTSSFTIIAFEFPETVATTFASLETFFGLGLIIGPTVGGALYQVGGYILPFLVTGAVLFLIAIASTFVMPKIETIADDQGGSMDGYGVMTVLKLPGVLIAALSMTITCNSIGFLSATLEPHLRQFSLSPVEVGLMFIIYGGIYAITAPGFGWICDNVAKPIAVSFAGAILIFSAFLLIGPAPFIPLNTTLWMTAVGLVILGFGLAATLVSGFISSLKMAMATGFPDNISTYGVISGLWTSSVSLGAFIGPSMGGFLLDHYNFRACTYYILGAQIIMILVLLVYVLVSSKINKPEVNEAGGGDSESAPLLRSTSDAESARFLRSISPMARAGDNKQDGMEVSYGTVNK